MNVENKRQFATIALAIGLGFVATFLTSQYVQKSIQKQTKFFAKEFQKGNSSMVRDIEEMKKGLNALAKNQKDLSERIEKPTASKKKFRPPKAINFSTRTPQGKRAVTIEVDPLSAVGGLINAGDFVDILAHLDSPDFNKKLKKKDVDKKKIITVLFQNIQVLAVGTNFRANGTQKEYQVQQLSKVLNLTLALSPEEASLLTFAQSKGTLQMFLRAPNDNIRQKIDVASWDSLSKYVLKHQGTELIIPKEKAKAEEASVQVFRGGESEEE